MTVRPDMLAPDDGSTGDTDRRQEPAQPGAAPPGARLVAELVDVDLASGLCFRDGVPHSAFDTLRAAGGIAWHTEQPIDPALSKGDLLQFVDSPGFWVVTSHELVTMVSRQPTLFSSQLGGVFMPSLAPESLHTFRQMMLNMDPPEHSRLRRIIQPTFTPKAVDQLRESVTVNAREIVDDLVDDHVDLVTAVSAEMPLRVLADLLGMPREDRYLIFEWSNGLLGFEDIDAGRNVEDALAAITGLLAYGQEMADNRRAQPRDDIVSRIVNAEVDGERLTDVEFSMFWLLLVIAGNETTRNALSGSVIGLLDQEQWNWLATHPEALPTAIEELLRFVSPVMQFRRTAREDTHLGDQRVRAGDKVVIWFGAANRDPEVFSDPHTLDLTRHPNAHMSFGVGPHFCLGAHLARLEMTEMLRQLLIRAPDLSLAGKPSRTPSNFINGISALPVRLGRTP